MKTIKDYEVKVINLLTSLVLPSSTLYKLQTESKIKSYEYTGGGYFLTVSHPNIPKERIICSEPVVIGQADDIICGFIVSMENRTLTIECHDWGITKIPEDFRDRDVKVGLGILESGNFKILNS